MTASPSARRAFESPSAQRSAVSAFTGHRLPIVAALLLASFCGACGGGGGGTEGEGADDVAAEPDVPTSEALGVCDERFLGAFSFGGAPVAVMRARDEDPLANTSAVRVSSFGATGALLEEAEASTADLGVLALAASGEVAALTFEALDGEGQVVARGRSTVVAGSAGPINVALRPSFWSLYDVADCQPLAPPPRIGQSLTPLPDGRVLLIGGAAPLDPAALPLLENAGELSAEMILLDPSTGELTSAGTYPVPLAFHTATALADGRVFVAGGLTGAAAALQPTTAARIVDPAASFAVSPAPVPLAGPRAGHRAVFAPASGGVLIVGGGTGGGQAEFWTPSGSQLVLPSQPRVNHTLTYLPDLERAIALGGELPGAQVDNSFEVFDLSSGAVSLGLTAVPADSQRTLHGAIYLQDSGRLYAVGGFRDGAHTQAISSLLVWDRQTQAIFVDSVALEAPRGAPSLVPLPDGSGFVVAGGVNATGLLAAAEAAVVLPGLPPTNTPQTAIATAPEPSATFVLAPVVASGAGPLLWAPVGTPASALVYAD